MDRDEERGAQQEERVAQREGDAQFEGELRQAMRRVNAPESLERFLMITAEAEVARAVSGKGVAKHGKILAFPRLPVWVSGAIAAMVVLGFLTGGEAHLRHERERAQATAEFEASVQITNQALAQTREQLERAGISLDQQ